MNENSRKVYHPAPAAGQMKCPKDGGAMKPSAKDPKISVCSLCGAQAKRVKLS